MAGICFYFEEYDKDVWSDKNFDAWNYACNIAGDIDSLIVINETDEKLMTPNASLEFSVVNTLEEAKDLMQGEIVHVVCPWDDCNKITVEDYKHTADWYIFGSANGWKGIDISNGITLRQAGQCAVHSVHACTVVMFNRYWTLNNGN